MKNLLCAIGWFSFLVSGCTNGQINEECIERHIRSYKTAEPDISLMVKKEIDHMCYVYHIIYRLDPSTKKEEPKIGCCDGNEQIIWVF